MAFFEEFAKTMPKGKNPTSKIALYKQRVKKVKARIDAFKVKYSKKRAAAKESRANRLAAEKEERKEEEALGKPVKTAIDKQLKKAKNSAAKAAAAAVEALGTKASTEEQMKVGMEAFQKAISGLVSAKAFLPVKAAA